MATIRLHQTTTATPEQFLAGLTDFGPGRSKIFPNSGDGYLKVHDQGPSHEPGREPYLRRVRQRPAAPGRSARAVNLRQQPGIADPEHLAGDAMALVAEQVRDDICYPVGCTRLVGLE